MSIVAFKVYDMDRDGFISNGELFLVLKMMVGNNLKDQQLQQIVDKTIMEADQDGDGKISFEEFKAMVANTDIAKQMTLDGELSFHLDDARHYVGFFSHHGESTDLPLLLVDYNFSQTCFRESHDI